jgi:hypothetical protein
MSEHALEKCSVKELKQAMKERYEEKGGWEGWQGRDGTTEETGRRKGRDGTTEGGGREYIHVQHIYSYINI